MTRHDRDPSLLMFGTFVAIDYFLNRDIKMVRMATENTAVGAGRIALGEFVEGFHVAQNVRYHPGHGWVLRARSHLAHVRCHKSELPKRWDGPRRMEGK